MLFRGCLVYLISFATFYSDFFNGRIMSNGKRFNQYATVGLTCASNIYPLGTVLEVKRLDRKITCVVSDRGAFSKRNIDLSKVGFSRLGPLSRGVLRVQVKVIGRKRK